MQRPAIRTDAPPTEPPDGDCQVEQQNDHSAKLAIVPFQDPRLNFHLIERSRKAVKEYETSLDTFQLCGNDFFDERRGHEFPGDFVRLNLCTQRSTTPNLGFQKIAGLDD
jgi:hypothetical protein